MYKQFPFSMENIPRQTSFGCFSLKIGSIFSALIVILYSVLALAQCLAIVSGWPHEPSLHSSSMAYGLVVVVAIVHAITLFLSTVMLIGALKEDARLMRPWVIWTSIQVMCYMLLFIFFMVNNFSDNSLTVYVIELLSLLAHCYMLVLVASYYKQLEEERDERLKSLINKDIWHEYA
ncbi:uncharacterized protein LOC133525553 [Cydia pomonella]|uniref:uncharacterized protein LOC133525553 n=1 Tax=Cydia pomonella TaxID=82600 RepID=UPI002ADE6704|nr:uncharacterized protein LOC133525553 [Cydia pomonella]